jgi:hypothetical protein
VRRKQAEVPRHAEPRRRDRRDDSSNQSERLEQHGARAVEPCLLYLVAHAAILETGEPHGRNRRTSQVPTQSLEPRAVVAVHGELRVQIDPLNESDRLFGTRQTRIDEPQRRRRGAGPEEIETGGGCLVAGGESRVLVVGLGRFDVFHFGVELSPVFSQDLLDALGASVSHLGHFFAGGRRELTKDERSTVPGRRTSAPHDPADRRRAIRSRECPLAGRFPGSYDLASRG